MTTQEEAIDILTEYIGIHPDQEDVKYCLDQLKKGVQIDDLIKNEKWYLVIKKCAETVRDDYMDDLKKRGHYHLLEMAEIVQTFIRGIEYLYQKN